MPRARPRMTHDGGLMRHAIALARGIRDAVSRERRQYVAYAGLSAMVLALAIVARVANPLAFQRLIGGTNPVLAAAALCVVGAALLYVLLERDGFVIVRSRPAPLNSWCTAEAREP